MNVAVIGYGSIGRRHVENLGYNVLGKEFGVSRIVVHDPINPPTLPVPPGAILLSNPMMPFQDFSRHPLECVWETEPDLVMICTPSALHIPQAVEAVKAGVGYIFIEKPLALKSTEIDLLTYELALVVYPPKFMVGCNLRFHPEIVRNLEMKTPDTLEMRMSGWLPDWRPHTAWEKQANVIPGVVLDSIHEIDLATYLAGPVIDCHGYTASFLIKHVLPTSTVEDTAKIIMRHKCGTLTSIHLSYFERTRTPRREVVLVQDGEDTTLVLNPTNEMYVNELRHLLGCVRDGTQPMNGLAEASEVLKWAIEARTEGASV